MRFIAFALFASVFSPVADAAFPVAIYGNVESNGAREIVLIVGEGVNPCDQSGHTINWGSNSPVLNFRLRTNDDSSGSSIGSYVIVGKDLYQGSKSTAYQAIGEWRSNILSIEAKVLTEGTNNRYKEK